MADNENLNDVTDTKQTSGADKINKAGNAAAGAVKKGKLLARFIKSLKGLGALGVVGIIIIIVIVVIILIVGIIAIGIGLYHDFKQESELISECEQIKELTNEENLDTEKINEMLTRRISDGEYLQVEEALKEYLTARFQNITKISEILNNEKLENILTIDNYKNDGPEFVTTKEYIENTKQELQELKNRY